MHGYPDWFMWLVVAVYWLIYLVPLAVVVVVWTLVRKLRTVTKSFKDTQEP